MALYGHQAFNNGFRAFGRKRFREVDPGKLYRSGQMTAAGFRETIERYNIKTVVNLQHEQPDPLLPENWLGKGKVHESELCQQLGVKYVLLTPDLTTSGMVGEGRCGLFAPNGSPTS